MSEPAPTPAPTSAPAAPVDPVSDQTPAPEPQAVRSFSQEELDRIVQERLARAKTTPPADYEDLKAAKAELDEIKKASQTEMERLQEQIKQTEERAAQAQAIAERQLVQAAVLTEATRANALKPEHMHRLIDTGNVTVADDGTVTGVEEAVAAFLEENPEYVGGRPKAGSVDQGARGGVANQITREHLKSMSQAEIIKAQNEGRLDSLLQGTQPR